ncbi:protein I'm not dead yet-like [Gigantopelta aegis]|uniref:protein I'm not dead yet-like n=1 Tax=Gigantopelta aegis TaxID=1735272 RepID=UPI001B88A0A7|nr:protein I'm not dead yet-like [Gigantopelta aegis]
MDEPRKGTSCCGVSARVVDINAAPLQPSACSQILAAWRFLVFVIAPIALIFLLFIGDDPAYRCAYLILLMAVFWITEVVPIAVTSLLPVFLCPMLGILTAKDTSSTYMNYPRSVRHAALLPCFMFCSRSWPPFYEVNMTLGSS